MKRVLFILCSIPLLLFSPVSFANAQETSDFSKLNPEDYTNISLPPLDLLFENAKEGQTAGKRKTVVSTVFQCTGQLPVGPFRSRQYLYGRSDSDYVQLQHFQTENVYCRRGHKHSV